MAYSGPMPMITLPNSDSQGIKIVHNPPSSTLDIVFIHGPGDCSFSTWTHMSTYAIVHWPTDFLKDEISHARIMTYGYDVDIVPFWEHAAENGLSVCGRDLVIRLARERIGYRENKIIFVAHSLGGLVVQRALTVSRESIVITRKWIEKNTIGICFLGTPQYGGDPAGWASALTDIIDLWKETYWVPISPPDRGSEMLRDVQTKFHDLLEKRKLEGNRIRIISFYETQVLPPWFKSPIVPKESATISGELAFPLPENHISMSRLAPSDPAYADVVAAIKWIAGIQDQWWDMVQWEHP